jgi:hypothetical protein
LLSALLFSVGPTQGDPVIELRSAAPQARRTREQWLELIKGRQLPSNWEANLEVSLKDLVTDAFVHLQMVRACAVCAVRVCVCVSACVCACAFACVCRWWAGLCVCP